MQSKYLCLSFSYINTNPLYSNQMCPVVKDPKNPKRSRRNQNRPSKEPLVKRFHIPCGKTKRATSVAWIVDFLHVGNQNQNLNCWLSTMRTFGGEIFRLVLVLSGQNFVLRFWTTMVSSSKSFHTKDFTGFSTFYTLKFLAEMTSFSRLVMIAFAATPMNQTSFGWKLRNTQLIGYSRKGLQSRFLVEDGNNRNEHESTGNLDCNQDGKIIYHQTTSLVELSLNHFNLLVELSFVLVRN